MSRPNTTIGRRSGSLVAVRMLPGRGKNKKVLCRCDCGKTKVVWRSSFAAGDVTRCDDCGAKSLNDARDHRIVVVQERGQKIVGWSAHTPLVSCRVCGGLLGETAYYHHTVLCMSCANKAKSDRPKVYPISIGTIARHCGISRQAVHIKIGRDGWDAALRFYREKYNLDASKAVSA